MVEHFFSFVNIFVFIHWLFVYNLFVCLFILSFMTAINESIWSLVLKELFEYTTSAPQVSLHVCNLRKLSFFSSLLYSAPKSPSGWQISLQNFHQCIQILFTYLHMFLIILVKRHC